MNYANKSYRMTMDDTCDSLTVGKMSGCDWSIISMGTNGKPNGEITIRSKEMAEALRFMLAQMLNGED